MKQVSELENRIKELEEEIAHQERAIKGLIKHVNKYFRSAQRHILAIHNHLNVDAVETGHKVTLSIKAGELE